MAAACKKAVKKDIVPSIVYTGLSPDKVASGSSKDTVSIRFTVTDADGDISGGTGEDVFLKDSRSTTGEEIKLQMPIIPTDAVKTDEGIHAFVTIRVYASLFLLLRPDRPNGDTLTYEIYVKDRAGNKSNVINTQRIFITP
ncbi:hypothetical protein CAP35_10795 [Chitinophagaceae bacterium IBVUCB1]|nr:hypothetical protein CAP35_10795 [Chitinophagaceae bacterium IBVUCB1]